MTSYDHIRIARHIRKALSEENRFGRAGLLATKQNIECMLVEMARAELLTRTMMYRHLAYLEEIYKREMEKMTMARSIEPEQKKGKWIRNENGTFSCNLCSSWIPAEQSYYARYCLYCGAEMRGEQDED